MELKSSKSICSYLGYDSFNRTAYGIEIFFRCIFECFSTLLIAPLMELKFASELSI